MTSKVKSYFLLFNLLFLVFFCYYNVFPQNGILMSVSGFVKNNNTKEPISGVVITLIKSDSDNEDNIVSGISDENGFYIVKYLKTGDYAFMINIPGEGNIYINCIGVGIDDKALDLYKLSVQEGKNLNLNLFLGKGYYPSVSRETLYDGLYINHTMIYTVNKDLFIRQSILSEGGCNEIYETLNINNSGEIITIGDEEKIPGWNCVDCFGGFSYSINIVSPINTWCDEINNYCKYRYGNPIITATFVGKILRHTENWLKSHISNQSPTADDETIKCYQEGIIAHERKHRDMSCQIVKEEWDNFLENIEKKVKCICEDNKFCVKHWSNLYNKFIKNVEERLRETEDEAVLAQKNKFEECKNSNKEVSDE